MPSSASSPSAAATKLIGSLPLLVLAVVVVAVTLLVSLLKPDAGELPVYIRAARNLVHHETLYRPTDLKPFTYPPFFAVPMLPFVLLPESWQRVVWALVNAGALLAGLLLVIRRVAPYLQPRGRIKPAPVWLFWTLVGILSIRHLLSPIENQSHDLLVFLLVVLAVDASCRVVAERRTGIWAGLAAACKATPALFLLVFLWQRRFLACGLLIATLVAATLLPDIISPAQEGRLRVVQWYQTFLTGQGLGKSPDAKGAWASWNRLNQSLAGTMYRLCTKVETTPFQYDVSLMDLDRQTLRWTTLAAQLAVGGWILLATRPGLSRGRERTQVTLRRFGEGGLAACGMVLLSPMSSKAHFAVLLLPMTFCLIHFLYRRRDPILGVLLGLIFLTSTLTAKDIWHKEISDQILSRGSVTFCALFCLLATGYVLLRRQKLAPDEPN